MTDRTASNLYFYPKLPRSGFGLCNMMFVWARALVASRACGASLLSPAWVSVLRFGPILRREKYIRYYIGEFTNEGTVRRPVKDLVLLVGKRYPEAELSAAIHAQSLRPSVVVFDGMRGYFRPILDQNSVVRDALYRMTNPRITEIVRRFPSDYIGVHVRRGDFKRIAQDIPVEWYVRACEALFRELGEELPVKVFSDAAEGELSCMNSLPNCQIMPKAPAIQDLLLLAQARIILGTSLSTFSLWASYLNRRPTVWPPISPGVWGYGLHTKNHIYTNWEGNLDLREFQGSL